MGGSRGQRDDHLGQLGAGCEDHLPFQRHEGVLAEAKPVRPWGEPGQRDASTLIGRGVPFDRPDRVHQHAFQRIAGAIRDFDLERDAGGPSGRRARRARRGLGHRLRTERGRHQFRGERKEQAESDSGSSHVP